MSSATHAHRLWPVVTVLCLSLAGVGLLEWFAAHREPSWDVVVVADSAGAEVETDDVTVESWQATEPIDAEHARARQLLRRDELSAAIEIYAALVAAEDTQAPLLAEYAYALRRGHRCRDAAPIVERALALAPNDGAVALSAALTWRCVGDEARALEAFARAVELRPNHSLTRLAYGEFLFDRGEYDAAVEILTPASTAGSNEERARALAALGRTYFARGERAEAREAFDQAIERAPAMVAVWMAASRTWLQSDNPADHQRALEHALQASRLAPQLAPPFSALGRAYEKLGMRLDAIDAYRRAARLDENYEYVRTRLVRLGLEEEEFALARRAAEGLLAIDPERAEYHFLSGLAAARGDDVEAARASYARAINLRAGDYAEAWYNLGILERDAGELEVARDAYQQAIAARPEYEEALNNLGLVLHDLGEYGAAESAFRQAIAIRARYAAAWINLGRTYAEQNNYARAADALERALEITPSSRVVRLRLAVAWRRIGRTADAINLYRSLVEDEPRYVAAWFNLGIALAADGQTDEAIEAYRTALDINPDHRGSLRNLGLLEAREGRNAEAIDHLVEALDRDPSDDDLRLKIAEVAFAAGDAARCLQEVRAVLARDEANPEAQQLLLRCQGY